MVIEYLKLNFKAYIKNRDESESDLMESEIYNKYW